MARYIIKHRRKTTSEWDALGRDIIHEGEFAIEYNDDYTMARILIGGKNGVDALQFNPVSKIRTILLPADAWVGTSSPYSQTFVAGSIDGVTAKSKIDLQPTVSLLEYLQNEEITLTSENADCVVTFYALNCKPDRDIEIQATISEVKS